MFFVKYSKLTRGHPVDVLLNEKLESNVWCNIIPTGATPAKNTANAAGALRNALTACNTLEGTKRFSGAVWISARNGQRTS